MDSAAYVTERTQSTNFPTASPFQATHGGGTWDAFVSKLNATGSALIYSTYLGGNGDDVGLFTNRIAVDSCGNAYVTGQTDSTNFPTANAFQAIYGGGFHDAFVTKFGELADLSVTKSNSPDPVIRGSNITYTVVVVNNGPSSATDVSLSDAVPGNTQVRLKLGRSGLDLHQPVRERSG